MQDRLQSLEKLSQDSSLQQETYRLLVERLQDNQRDLETQLKEQQHLHSQALDTISSQQIDLQNATHRLEDKAYVTDEQ